MQSFINYHLKKYPKSTTQDLVKLLYQNHFGPAHFIENINVVIQYYYSELVKNINNNNFYNLYEHIGNDFIRVNIIPFSKNFSNPYLINSFYESSLFDFNNIKLKNDFKNCLSLINNDGFLDNYDYQDVHHSSIYYDSYSPHYRIINKKYLTLDMKVFQLQNYINSFNDFQIFALEGKCTSGKTTISSKLKDVTIIDVDEFFLRNDLKTKERLEEIGGNIDYELYEQCLKQIKANTTITYTIFDCSTQQYLTKTIEIKNKVLLVGVYSFHPKVRKYIDKLCYLLVSNDEQYNRLKERPLFNRFINEWVPLENKYYESYDFISNADILI